MAALYFTLLCVLVTFVVLPTARASGITQVLYQRNTGMDGQKPTTTALFQTPAHSPIDCGIQCSRVDGCRSFTYIADKSSSCRGYDVAMTSQTVMTPAAGAKTFEVGFAVTVSSWLESPCNSTSDCPVTKSECYKGRCLCTPGYFYSAGNRTCLTDCPLADLAGGLVKYKDSYFSGTHLWHGIVHLTTCRERCVHAGTNCSSFLYNTGALYCHQYTDTALTHPSDFYRDNSVSDYYQRTCN